MDVRLLIPLVFQGYGARSVHCGWLRVGSYKFWDSTDHFFLCVIRSLLSLSRVLSKFEIHI